MSVRKREGRWIRRNRQLTHRISAMGRKFYLLPGFCAVLCFLSLSGETGAWKPFQVAAGRPYIANAPFRLLVGKVRFAVFVGEAAAHAQDLRLKASAVFHLKAFQLPDYDHGGKGNVRLRRSPI